MWDSASERIAQQAPWWVPGDVLLVFVDEAEGIRAVVDPIARAGRVPIVVHGLGIPPNADVAVIDQALLPAADQPFLRERLQNAGPVLVLVELARNEARVRRLQADVVAIARDTFYVDVGEEPGEAENPRSR